MVASFQIQEVDCPPCRGNSTQCPSCKSTDLYRLVYGLVDPFEIEDTDDAGHELKLEGCVVPDDAPGWECKDCGERFQAEEDPMGLDEQTIKDLAPSLDDLTQKIVAFREERDWRQFHTPINLAAALSVEAAELQELFLWQHSNEANTPLEDAEVQEAAEREIADVLIYALLFCEAIGADPAEVIRSKLEENEERYPTDLSRGRATKYTELKDDPEEEK